MFWKILFISILFFIATTTVGPPFAKFKEAGTSFQHFLSTFINFKQIAWRYMLMFIKSLSKMKIYLRHVKVVWPGCPASTFKTSAIMLYMAIVFEFVTQYLFRNAFGISNDKLPDQLSRRWLASIFRLPIVPKLNSWWSTASMSSVKVTHGL